MTFLAKSPDSFSLKRFLSGLQALGLAVPCLLVLMFPVWVAVWELWELFSRSHGGGAPLLSAFFENFDAGGQSALARALCRSLWAAACVGGLLLPWGGKRRSKVPWGGLFLIVGLLSAAASPRAVSSQVEWESWALLLLLGKVLLQFDSRKWQFPFLAVFYITAITVCLHSLLVAVPGTSGRLGGVFHHSNALSTFCLICLPLLVWRASGGGRESTLAALLAGAVLSLQIWSGSLTGACILFGFLGWWTLGPESRLRLPALLVGLIVPASVNLALPGDISKWVYPTLLTLSLVVAWARNQDRLPFRRFLLFFVSLVAWLGLFAALTPSLAANSSAALHKRDNSGAARVEFYGAALEMVGESPILGKGPGGFAHQYPRHQHSIRYFSKFVHCLPLEIATEWGLLGLSLAMAACYHLARGAGWKSTIPVPVLAWTAAAFVLHSLTGVQSQFPYLAFLLVLGWGVSSHSTEDDGEREVPASAIARPLLAIVLLQLVVLNTLRSSSCYDRALGFAVYKVRGKAAATVAERFMASSVSTMPVDELAWFQRGLLAEAIQDPEAGKESAEMALQLDSQWAAPWELYFRCDRTPTAEQVERALVIDPINYPTFYRMKAESVLREGNVKGARRLLEEQATAYQPHTLNAIAVFRANDLKDQLVEYWVLLAMLFERGGHSREAEQALRMAMLFAEKRVSRLRRMVDYPRRAGLEPGGLVKSVLSQLAAQLKGE